ncbi:disulfide bond formation protein B [Reyranella sp. CPCC 100927]|uniref:disulfide bond formation protein B n=1 Tax=Reyranella sp. CPCC 100927 TaxID=2599616 RepID=UPI0011B5E9A7|nr:disulfide bond formation protein B [Reyranella sp. CPCC 100927]TWS99858.1 disulfide bond formation protein B [Reyranella sp. CPCC 100927]
MSSITAVATIDPPRSSGLDLPAIAALCGSGAILLGALGFQYLGGYPPCSLCYWQRYGHVAVMALAWLALLPLGRSAKIAFATLSGVALLATAGIAVYHVGVEWKWWAGPSGCTGAVSGLGMSVEELKRILMGTKMIRCDEIPWSLFGLSMAGWNAVLSAILGGWVLERTWRSAPKSV